MLPAATSGVLLKRILHSIRHSSSLYFALASHLQGYGLISTFVVPAFLYCTSLSFPILSSRFQVLVQIVALHLMLYMDASS